MSKTFSKAKIHYSKPERKILARTVRRTPPDDFDADLQSDERFPFDPYEEQPIVKDTPEIPF